MADRRSCRSALSSSVRTFHAATRICFLFRGTWFFDSIAFLRPRAGYPAGRGEPAGSEGTIDV